MFAVDWLTPQITVTRARSRSTCPCLTYVHLTRMGLTRPCLTYACLTRTRSTHLPVRGKLLWANVFTVDGLTPRITVTRARSCLTYVCSTHVRLTHVCSTCPCLAYVCSTRTRSTHLPVRGKLFWAHVFTVNGLTPQITVMRARSRLTHPCLTHSCSTRLHSIH